MKGSCFLEIPDIHTCQAQEFYVIYHSKYVLTATQEMRGIPSRILLSFGVCANDHGHIFFKPKCLREAETGWKELGAWNPRMLPSKHREIAARNHIPGMVADDPYAK